MRARAYEHKGRPHQKHGSATGPFGFSWVPAIFLEETENAMTTASPETSFPGSRTQEDRNLFADIKTADWLDARNGLHINGQGFQQGSSGSILLDDIRAADAVNTIRAHSDEPDEQRDQMEVRADPIFLKWVKGVGWVRSGTPVVVPGEAKRVGPPTEQPRALSDGACQSVEPFAVSTAARTRWMLPQGPAPPTWKAIRKYRGTPKFLNNDHASVGSQLACSVEVCSSQRESGAIQAYDGQAPLRKRRHAVATRNAPFHGGSRNRDKPAAS